MKQIPICLNSILKKHTKRLCNENIIRDDRYQILVRKQKNSTLKYIFIDYFFKGYYKMNF